MSNKLSYFLTTQLNGVTRWSKVSCKIILNIVGKGLKIHLCSSVHFQYIQGGSHNYKIRWCSYM